jgi:hypothetical protein
MARGGVAPRLRRSKKLTEKERVARRLENERLAGGGEARFLPARKCTAKKARLARRETAQRDPLCCGDELARVGVKIGPRPDGGEKKKGNCARPRDPA